MDKSYTQNSNKNILTRKSKRFCTCSDCTAVILGGYKYKYITSFENFAF